LKQLPLKQPDVPLAVRALGWGVVVVVVALAAVFVVQLVLKPAPAGPITALTFTQSQSVPGFHPATRTVTDPAQIARFTKLTQKYSVAVTAFDDSLNDVCTGGLETRVTLRFADSTMTRFRLYDCSGGVAKGTFVTDATALFSGWRLR
jgi:hypothetical protein